MPPKPFYEIDSSAFLFGKSETPEEKVRQWTIFELLSTYGFNINDIQVEVPCKIGSKYFRADIVIYRERAPLIVIDCKRQEDKNQEEVLKQVESYANFLKANFLVITNGQSWVVKRNIEGVWWSITDIPTKNSTDFTKTITFTLQFIHKIEPILYWVYQSVPKKNAYSFFGRFLYFFQGEVRETIRKMGVRFGLRSTVENLLCVLGAGGNEGDISFISDDPYNMKKMRAALLAFSSYIDNIGFERISEDKNFEGFRFNELLGILSGDINDLVKNQKGITNNEFLLLRLTSALTEYLWQIFETKSYVEISITLMREIEAFVDEALKLELNSGLPDSLDTEDCRLMKIYSSEKWEAN